MTCLPAERLFLAGVEDKRSASSSDTVRLLLLANPRSDASQTVTGFSLVK